MQVMLQLRQVLSRRRQACYKNSVLDSQSMQSSRMPESLHATVADQLQKSLCYGNETIESGEGVWLRSCGSAQQ